MKCWRCGSDNAFEARFCGTCGTDLAPSSAVPQAMKGTVQGAKFHPWKSAGLWSLGALGGLILVVAALWGWAISARGLAAVPALIFLFVGLSVGGLFLWAGATGHWWPRTHKPVPLVLRVLLPLFPLAVNGLLGVAAGMLTSCQGEFCGGASPGIGALIGLAVFAGAALLELGAFLLVWGVIKGVQRFASQAGSNSRGTVKADSGKGSP